MTDTDHNRSNDSDTSAKALDREDELLTPSHSGSAGGDMARDVGMRDEEKASGEDAGEGRDPSITGVHKSDRPDGGSGLQGSGGESAAGMSAGGGDEPNMPSRDGNSTGFREQR